MRGATTGFVTLVNLREANAEFKTGFFDGTINDGEIAGIKGEGGVIFCWTSSRQLNIETPIPKTIEPKHEWREVSITYDRTCP